MFTGSGVRLSIPGHPWMQGFPITRPAFGSISVRPAMVLCSPVRASDCPFLCFREFLAPETSGGVELSPRSSQEVKGSLELQNSSLRVLEEASMKTSRLRHIPVKFGRFLEFCGRAVLAEQARGQCQEP